MLSPACLVGPAQHSFVSAHAQLLALIARDSTRIYVTGHKTVIIQCKKISSLDLKLGEVLVSGQSQVITTFLCSVPNFHHFNPTPLYHSNTFLGSIISTVPKYSINFNDVTLRHLQEKA